MRTYEVIDCRTESTATPISVVANTVEEAGNEVLGLALMRGGHHRNLVCKVYWNDAGGQKSMVRLYSG